MKIRSLYSNFHSMIREKYKRAIEEHFEIHKVCGLLGPRQCGKTTLAMQFAHEKQLPRMNIFDLENPLDLERLSEPMLALEPLKGFVIIDEVQHKPDLFPILRVLADREEAKFLVLGSASGDLLKQSAETLAGRIGYIEMTPFQLTEVDAIDTLWLRGGFPLSYLAKNNKQSTLWRQNYIKTFLEKDIPQLGFSIPPTQLRRFWLMLCHYHGQLFNASELGISLGLSYHTIQKYLAILQGTFMVRALQPWYENLKKRQVKTPKVYFRDSGLYHTLLGLSDQQSLLLHPKLGASWEGFALEEVIRFYDADPEECYFWSSHNVSEIDLLILKDGKRRGFEFKYTQAPKMTRSLKIAQEDLKLDECVIIYPGALRFHVSETIQAIGLEAFVKQAFLSS